MADEQWQLDLFGLPPKAVPTRKAIPGRKWKPVYNTRHVREWCTFFVFKTEEQAIAFEAVLESRFHFPVRPHNNAAAESPAHETEPSSRWIVRVNWARRRGKAIKPDEPEIIKLARELGGIYDVA